MYIDLDVTHPARAVEFESDDTTGERSSVGVNLPYTVGKGRIYGWHCFGAAVRGIFDIGKDGAVIRFADNEERGFASLICWIRDTWGDYESERVDEGGKKEDGARGKMET